MTTTTGASLEHAIGAEGLLAIRIRTGFVRLRGIDGEVARVRDLNDNDLHEMLAIEAAEGSLSLRSGRGLEIVIGPRRHRGNGRHTPELEIDLPRGASLVIEAVSGDIESDGLTGDQRYRTASGDVTLQRVSGRIDIEAVSGDVDIVATGTADVIGRTVSGDLSLRAATLASLRATTTSGDLRIAGILSGAGPFSIETVSGDALLAPAGEIRIEMNSVTGDLTSEFDGPSIRRGRRSLEIGKSGPTVTFQSMSGDLRVVRPVAVDDLAARASVTSPQAPSAPTPPINLTVAAAYEVARLRILRSLERGEIDVAEAGRRLETLDNGDPGALPAPAVDA
jgi:hypothetical protein